MKVKEICGFSQGNFRFSAYYHAKINDKNAIIERLISYYLTATHSGLRAKQRDVIMDVTYVDEENIEDHIQHLVEESKKIDIDESDRRYIEPFQMEKGREIDLNLANIEIPRLEHLYLYDADIPYYQYLVNKKFEELKLDRLEQLKMETQNNPNFYCLEKYLKKYESQSGQRLDELQINSIRDLDNNIQDGVILGKYNIEDYKNFLQLIPDLLSQKKALAIGHCDEEGRFFVHGEVYEKPIEAEDVSEYTTYKYHRLVNHENRFANENFKIETSPSIKKRTNPFGDKLCGVDLNDDLYMKAKEEENVILKGVEKKDSIKKVGWHSRTGLDCSYNDSGILFSQPRTNKLMLVKSQVKLSARDIATELEEISREGLATNAQEHIIELTNNKLKPEENSREEERK